MMPSPMEKDYWRTRTIAEAEDQDYSHLRLTCACGRITDYPFTLLLQRQGVSRESFRPFGSPVFARAGKTDPPSRLILSQTSAGKRCLAYVIGSSSSRAVPLFVPCGRSFVPARACAETPRARVVKAGRRAKTSPLAPVLPGHALTDPSTARHSRRSGRHLVHAVAFEVALLVEDGPGDTGKLVGERDRENVVVKPLLSRFDPGLEPVAFPALWPDQHDPGRLHEQDAQVAIAAPRYLAEDRAVSSRYLLGHQSKPGAEVAAFGEHISSANCGNHRARDDRPHAGHRHQPIACRILMGERCDLGRKALNALVQPAPVASQVLDYPCHAWRQGLGARGKEVRQLGTQEA